MLVCFCKSFSKLKKSSFSQSFKLRTKCVVEEVKVATKWFIILFHLFLTDCPCENTLPLTNVISQTQVTEAGMTFKFRLLKILFIQKILILVS